MFRSACKTLSREPPAKIEVDSSSAAEKMMHFKTPENKMRLRFLAVLIAFCIANLLNNRRIKFAPSGGTELPPCRDLTLLTNGTWDNASETFEPSHCSFEPFPIGNDFTKLVENHEIGFYGDSVLKGIALQIIKLTNITMETPMEGWSHAQKGYLCGGVKTLNGGIKVYWTPSGYHQYPSAAPSFRTDTISVIGIGAWDMGAYYRGPDQWYTSMFHLLREAVKSRKGKPLYVMNLHGVYPSRCSLKHNGTVGLQRLEVCKQCNTRESLFSFRSALQTAVACVRNNTEFGANLHIIDTLGVTAYGDPFVEPRSDGVHFDEVVSNMEANVILAAILKEFRAKDNGSTSTECPRNAVNHGRRIEQCVEATAQLTK